MIQKILKFYLTNLTTLYITGFTNTGCGRLSRLAARVATQCAG